jgi:hypothetical protein
LFLLQSHCRRIYTLGLLGATLAAGLVTISPYDAATGQVRWHFGRGYYAQHVLQAHDNRLGADAIAAALTSMPDRSILIARCSWTTSAALLAGVRHVANFCDVPGLVAFGFDKAGPNRVAIHFQDPRLPALLAGNASREPSARWKIQYDQRLQALASRWYGIHLEQFGSPFNLELDLLCPQAPPLPAAL